jgi:acetylornithine/succinyldiaminopimelate/putrescine aminotransferase
VSAIREIRGKGLLIGLELDRPAGAVVDACRDRGLLVLTAGEKILRMTPPLIVDEHDADRAVAIVGDVLRQTKP